MKLIRCNAQQPQVDDILDALEAFEISSLTVATGGEVVRVLEEICGTGTHPESGRILVLTVDECHRVRARRIA